LRNLIEDTEYGIEEGFVFNFEKNVWMKYSKSQGAITDNTSWSDVLSGDLKTIMD
jgi:ATP-dependent phosphoenolpyruvate carboxykinase